MQHNYEIHYLLGNIKRTVRIPAPGMDYFLALKIALTHAGKCAGKSLPIPALHEILELAAQSDVANVRWNKAVSFTRLDVALQHDQYVCPHLVDDHNRHACTRVACFSNPEACASSHETAI